MGSRWLRFTSSEMQGSEGAPVSFALNEDGTVTIDGGGPEEMDFAAERLAREMMQGPQ